MPMERDDMTFSACGNTLAGMEKKAGQPIPLRSKATVVPSGGFRLIELQESGFAYVRLLSPRSGSSSRAFGDTLDGTNRSHFRNDFPRFAGLVVKATEPGPG